MATLLVNNRVNELPASGPDGGLWLPTARLESLSGWHLEPQGACLGDVCVPLPKGREGEFVQGDWFNLGAFAEYLSQPVVYDEPSETWCIGDSAQDMSSALTSTEAPDFEVRDYRGEVYRRSDFLGKKVFMVAWASWCGCRHDLPSWQKLQDELSDTNFQVVTVALESRGVEAALPYIEAANPTHPSLVDPDHTIGRAYGLINVPMSVWIDEEGKIVRPPEVAGATDAFRRMDRSTSKMADEDIAEARETKRAYVEGLRDWARRGKDSPWVLSADEVRQRIVGPSPEQARAAAYFRLGEYLWEQGNRERAQANFDEAKRLHPENWSYRRQAWDLEEQGKSMGPEFWKAIAELGETRYYPVIKTP